MILPSNDTTTMLLGSITYEALNIFGHDAPEICAEYVQKHDYSMIHDGNGITRKKIQYMINAVKVKSFCNVQYIYGVCIPHDKKEVLKLDEENSNDNWKEAI